MHFCTLTRVCTPTRVCTFSRMLRGGGSKPSSLLIVIALSLAALRAAAGPPADLDWTSYNGSTAADRFSPGTQITRSNVTRLRPLFRCETGEVTAFQSSPVEAGGTLFVTTAMNTYAFDARTGRRRWVHRYNSRVQTSSFPTGIPNRGVAYAQGRVFRDYVDAHLVALDAKTGKILWNVAAGDYTHGDYYNVAPLVWGGLVFVGNAGSDIGLIGRVQAFDARTGRRVWDWSVVPQNGPAAATWSHEAGHAKAGGGMYSSFALDAATGQLYVPTGNPGPDFAADYRPGTNLYTCCVVKLDARTGTLRGWQQFTPHDFHDWDNAAPPALFRSRAGRAMVAVASKNGNLYGLTRDLRSVIYRVPVARIENADAPLTPAGTHFFPGTAGGVNWNGPAYSPVTDALFVNAIDWGSTVKLDQEENPAFLPGKPFLGSANNYGDYDPAGHGRLTAVSVATGRILWTYFSPTPMLVGVTPTAGGLVFTGDLNGHFLALDQRSGRVLYRSSTGLPVGGGVTAYRLAGRDYVAVAAGLNSVLWHLKSSPAAVVVYGLPAR